MFRPTAPLSKMASTRGGMRRILKKGMSAEKFLEMACKAGTYKSPGPKGPGSLTMEDLPRDFFDDGGGGGGQRGQRNPKFQTRWQREEQMKRRRGIIDYPIEHEILRMNPPCPPAPRTPVRLRKKIAAEMLMAERLKKKEAKKEATREAARGGAKRGEGAGVSDNAPPRVPPSVRRLAKSYLRRRDDRLRSSRAPPPGAAREEEELHSRLLLGMSSDEAERRAESVGSSPASLRSAMGRKSAAVESAYAFALKQREAMLSRGSEDAEGGGWMSEDQAADEVERILREEARVDRRAGRRAADGVVGWRKERSATSESEGSGKGVGGELDSTAPAADGAADDAVDDGDSTVPSILHDRPRAVRAVSIWAGRLAAVPYTRWTVGAASALDHWIAREVLRMDEDTWSRVQSGGGADTFTAGVETGETPGGLVARARDVVAVRGALFPETLAEDDEDVDDVGGGGLDAALSSLSSDPTEKSIDELLRSLGEIDGDDDDDDSWKFDDDDVDAKAKEAGNGKSGDEKDDLLDTIVDELQVWRKRQLSSPYESWDDDRRGEFDRWLERYVEALSDDDGNDSKSKKVDMEATRKALLSRRPLNKEDSEDFWANVQDETQAEIYLQEMRADAEKELRSLRETSQEGRKEPTTTAEEEEPKARIAELETFLSVPYDVQLRRFADAGALRPLLDEYASSGDRSSFLERHSGSFLEGLELEHLVPDPDGSVGWDDLGPDLRAELSREDSSVQRKERRYSVQKIPYGTDEYGTSRASRARDLYRLWNEHKSNRARYEEAMFKRGELGLDEVDRKGMERARAREKRRARAAAAMK